MGRQSRRRRARHTNSPLSNSSHISSSATYHKRPRSRNFLPFILGIGIAAVLSVFIVLYLTLPSSVTPRTPVPAYLLREVTHPSTSVLSSINSKGVTSYPAPITKSHLPSPTSSKKPWLLYVGGEFCPYCAAERWSLIVALSRFGHFSNLSLIASSPTDVYPNTHSFSFHHSTYQSPYLTFVPVEQYTNTPRPQGGYTILQPLNPAENKLIQQFDSCSSCGLPFLDFNNQFVNAQGSNYSPQILQGLTWKQIGLSLSHPQSPVAQSILGTANMLTAAICSITHNADHSVCSAPYIQTIEQAHFHNAKK